MRRRTLWHHRWQHERGSPHLVCEEGVTWCQVLEQTTRWADKTDGNTRQGGTGTLAPVQHSSAASWQRQQRVSTHY